MHESSAGKMVIVFKADASSHRHDPQHSNHLVEPFYPYLSS